MSSKNYRKITVGDSFSNCIAYVKGAMYLGRTTKITDIIPSEELENALDVYVIKNGETASTIWKTIPKKIILDIEYDLNFD